MRNYMFKILVSSMFVVSSANISLAQSNSVIIPSAGAVAQEKKDKKDISNTEGEGYQVPSQDVPKDVIKREDPLKNQKPKNKEAVERPYTIKEIEERREEIVNRNAATILTPNDINKIKDKSIEARSAAARPWPSYVGKIKMLPKKIAISKNHNAETITIGYRMITPVLFEDSSGKPWPIEGISYDPRIFSIDGAGCGSNTSNSSSDEDKITFNISPCEFKGYGNITVRLRNIATPLVFLMQSGDFNVIDAPVNISVYGKSPIKRKFVLANASSVKKKKVAPSKNKNKKRNKKVGSKSSNKLDIFHSLINGTPLRGAVLLSQYKNSKIYNYKNKIYVVGNIKIIAPSPSAQTQDREGKIFVYRFDKQIHRLLISHKGNEASINLN